VNLAVHFRARSSLILNCSSGSFLFFYITLLVGVMERKKRIVGGRKGER